MSDFDKIEVTPTHAFRRLSAGDPYGAIPIDANGYGLMVDEVVVPTGKSVAANDASDALDVRLMPQGLMVLWNGMWIPLRSVENTHDVATCEQVWKEEIDHLLSAPEEFHRRAFPFYDRPIINPWSRDDVDTGFPQRIGPKFSPSYARQRRKWRQSLVNKLGIDFPDIAQHAPGLGTEVSLGLEWTAGFRRQLAEIQWHDPVQIGMKYDPDAHAFFILIGGLNPEFPTGLTAHFDSNGLRFQHNHTRHEDAHLYIGPALLAVAELAFRASRTSEIVVFAADQEDIVAELTVQPEHREITLMQISKDWPQIKDDTGVEFKWHI